MNTLVKFGAALSALFLLAACETPTDGSGNVAGDGSGNSNWLSDSNGNVLAPGVGDRVFFGYDSSTLTPEGMATLESQANWLKSNSSMGITIEGHCDERGTREYNLALGERRASAARNYLVNLGVNASRITTVSYGKERPAVVGSNESAWGQNRRAVTVIAR